MVISPGWSSLCHTPPWVGSSQHPPTPYLQHKAKVLCHLLHCSHPQMSSRATSFHLRADPLMVQTLWSLATHLPPLLSAKEWMPSKLGAGEDSWKSLGHQGDQTFPESSVGKESTCNARDPGSIPRSGRSPGEGMGYPLQYSWASLVAQLVKNLPAMWETWVWSLGWEDPLEKGKATHSSILAWRIPWTV